MEFKTLLKRYKKPTPWQWRKIGDTLLWLFNAGSMISIIMADKWIAIILLICGLIGKAITNLSVEKDKLG